MKSNVEMVKSLLKIPGINNDLLRNNKERCRVEGMSREGLIKKHASD